MRDYLQTSDPTESRSCIRSFVEEIAVAPGAATIRYAIPLPADSATLNRDATAVALKSPVLSTVNHGRPNGTVHSTTFELVVAL